MANEYIESNALVKPSCLIQLGKYADRCSTGRLCCMLAQSVLKLWRLRPIQCRDGGKPWNAGAMQNTPTHYELLNVARDASPEQIKRAYRKLAQQLHPDRNPAANASDLMSRVNVSHAVLADPVKRAVYDAELAQSEQRSGDGALVSARQGAAAYAATAQAAAPVRKPAPRPAKKRPTAKPAAAPAPKRRRRNVLRWALLFMIFCAAGAWMGYDRNASLSYTPTDALPVHAQVHAQPSAPVLAQAPATAPPAVPAEADCAVPQAGPHGAAWPAEASYLQGMPLLRQNGWSQIVIDNSGSDSALYAKVTDAVGRNAYRHAYIPAGGQFSFMRMDAGYYLLKYQVLKTGCVFASTRILLEETPMGSQVKSSVYRMNISKLKGAAFAPVQLKLDQF